jgi:hypothetical protein
MVSAGVKLIRLDWPDTSAMGGLYHLGDVDEGFHGQFGTARAIAGFQFPIGSTRPQRSGSRSFVRHRLPEPHGFHAAEQ